MQHRRRTPPIKRAHNCRGVFAAQQASRIIAVRGHLLDERIHAAEHHFCALERDKLNANLLAIDVVAKIEKMHLKTRRTVVKLRSFAIACDAFKYAPIEKKPDSIDPEFQADIDVKRQVRGRKAKLSPTFIAVHHDAV